VPAPGELFPPSSQRSGMNPTETALKNCDAPPSCVATLGYRHQKISQP
jgi:hypothetical protein